MVNEFNTYMNDIINQYVPNSDTVSTALNYSLIQCQGKRIRPLCVITSALALDANSKASALDLAVAIECIHTYSLIHDDLPCMDNDDLRRGNPTNHKVYGEAFALLAGDALNTLAFQIIATSKTLNDQQIKYAINALATNAGVNGMILGQCLDLESEGKTIDYEVLEQLHLKKTGCLLVASLQLGAVAAKRYDLLDYCYKIGSALGLAFQIQDDILDVTKTSQQLGKSNSDLANEKCTSVSLLGIAKAQSLAEQCFDYVAQSIKTIYAPHSENMLTLVNSIINRQY